MYLRRNEVCCFTVLVFKLAVICHISAHNVTTPLGSIYGTIEKETRYHENGTEQIQYVRYLGVPYAEPPVGPLRFSKPVTKQPLSSTHNGSVHRPSCYHSDGRKTSVTSSSANIVFSEDCLFLDIYAPVKTTNGSKNLPVMVFIPPSASSSQFYPGGVISEYGNIIYVAINYRTGLLGFFSMGDDIAPGNFGLWDQQMALKWVHSYIRYFGGDPDRVTLVSFGEGASQAILQSMYPGNRNLIHRVIAQSGTPIPTYKTSSLLQPPEGRAMAGALGCSQASSEQVLLCMKALSLADINTRLSTLEHSVTLTPVIDGDFILGHPYDMLTSNDSTFDNIKEMFGSQQLLTGLSNMEGGTHVARMWAQLLGTDMDTFTVNRSSFDTIVVPVAVELIFGKNVSDAVIKTVAFQYTDGKQPHNKDKLRDSVVALSTDLDTSVPVLKTTDTHSKLSKNSSYLYQFSAKFGLKRDLTPNWLEGANHGDFVFFLLGFTNLKLSEQYANYTPTQNEINTSYLLMNLCTNFAKTGNPNLPISGNPPWQPYNHDNSPYLDIGLNDVTSGLYFREPYMRFWVDVIPKLMEETSMVSKSSKEEDVCTEHNGDFNSRFKVGVLTSDNIILTLIISCSFLFFAFILACCIAMLKGSLVKYTIKQSDIKETNRRLQF